MRFGIGRKTAFVVIIALLTIVSSACAQSKEQSSEAKMKEIEAQIEKARNLRFKGDNEGALREQLKAVELDPNYGELWMILASIYADLEHWDKAIETAQKAISIDSNDARSYTILSYSHERLGDDKKALEYQKEALRLEPNNVKLLVNLGLKYNLLDDKKSAREYISKAIQINPDYAYAWYQMADFEVEDGNLEKAIELFQKTSKLKPTRDDEVSNDEYFIDKAKKRVTELQKKLN